MSAAPPSRRDSLFEARPWLAPLGLVLAVVLAYWNSLRSPFLFDDTGAIINNPTIRHLGSVAVLNPPSDGSTTTGRPVVNLTYALNFAVSGENVWSYHAFNLAIHALAALVLMDGLRRTLQRGALAPTFAAAAAALAFWTALLWALHPLLTETVTGIAQRTEELCGLFYLLTLYGFIRTSTPGRPPSRLWQVCCVGSCLVGMATKEVMVTAPLVVFLYDRTFVAGTFAAAWRQRRGLYVALAATWLLLAFLLWRNGGARGTAAGFGLGISGWNYLLQQCIALVLYLKLSFFPFPLVLDYGTAVAHSPGEVWWQGLVVFALLVATLRAFFGRHPAAGFIGVWFFVLLAPSSSFVPLVTQTMAEHRMYLPLAAIMTGLVLSIFRYLGSRASWLLAVLALASGGLTAARNYDYRDPVVIWKDTVLRAPLNPRAHNNLAWALQAAHQPAEANLHFARAIELQPDYVAAHYSYGVALLDQGRADEAVAQFAAAVKNAPNHGDAELNLGNALMQVQRAAEAIPHYQNALRLRPAADANFDLGVALIAADRPAEASPYLETALRLNPQLAEAQYQLGRIAELSGQAAAAEARYAATLQLNPDHVGAHRQWGLLLAHRDQLDPAADHFRAVIRVRPNDAEAQANLGNVLLLQGKIPGAIACYELSLRLRPDDPRTRENLQLAREAQGK